MLEAPHSSGFRRSRRKTIQGIEGAPLMTRGAHKNSVPDSVPHSRHFGGSFMQFGSSSENAKSCHLSAFAFVHFGAIVAAEFKSRASADFATPTRIRLFQSFRRTQSGSPQNSHRAHVKDCAIARDRGSPSICIGYRRALGILCRLCGSPAQKRCSAPPSHRQRCTASTGRAPRRWLLHSR